MHLAGTALMIADRINKRCNNRYKYVFSRNSYVSSKNAYIASNNSYARTKNEIAFSSVRGGSVIGEHSVLFLGDNESIELTHTAYSRNIYVEGALRAAQFIITKKNGMYDMSDLL